MRTSLKFQFPLVAGTIALLLPFLHKAFHVDDPLFLWMAQQIAKHPADPYGFLVNWTSFPEPMWQQMQNPPLCSYYMAAIASVLGWTEVSLHLGFLLWPVLAVLATYRLATRILTPRKPVANSPSISNVPERAALTATILTVLTPVFLVSATNVMSDVMLLAFWLWSIERWLVGVEEKKRTALAVSAIFASAAVLTKYFGIALVPLLGSYALLRRPRRWSQLLFLLIPIAAVLWFELWTRGHYGRGLLSAAIFFARGATKTVAQQPAGQLMVGLAFVGGSIMTPLLVSPGLSRRAVLVAVGLLVAGLTLFSGLVRIDPGWTLGINLAAVRLEGGIFAGIGMGVLALGLTDLVEDPGDARRWLLFLWLFGTFGFVAFCNWSITARTVLPLVPAAAILLVRRVRVGWVPVIACGLASLAVAVTDYCQAGSAREAAAAAEQRFQGEPGRTWFQSHWGFQYYMQRWGATPLNSRDSEINSGDFIVIPANNVVIVPIPAERVFPPDQVNFSVLPFITTMGRGTGASFYSSIRGPIPWAIDQVPPEMYYFARFR